MLDSPTLPVDLSALADELAKRLTDRLTAPALLSAKAAAAYCGLSTRTIWTLAASEQFPSPIRVGGRTLWRRADVDAWIAEQGQAHRSGGAR